MNENKIEKYNAMPVKKAVVQNIIPAMLAMLMTLVYNVADTFFIGQTHNAFHVAAVSLATPVFLIYMSVGNIFGIGGYVCNFKSVWSRQKRVCKKSLLILLLVMLNYWGCAFCFVSNFYG